RAPAGPRRQPRAPGGCDARRRPAPGPACPPGATTGGRRRRPPRPGGGVRPPRAPSGPGASLVQAVLHPDPAVAGAAGRRYLDQVDLQLIPWPQARVLPLLYKRMAAVGEPTPPLLRGTYRKAWTQNQLRFRATMATVEALDRAGIRTLVLK